MFLAALKGGGTLGRGGAVLTPFQAKPNSGGVLIFVVNIFWIFGNADWHQLVTVIGPRSNAIDVVCNGVIQTKEGKIIPTLVFLGLIGVPQMVYLILCHAKHPLVCLTCYIGLL